MIAELFKKFSAQLSKLSTLPSVRADDDDDEEEELHDPLKGLRAKCILDKEGSALKRILDECNARVRSRKQTAETCEEELHDLYHYLDHCASKELFHHLK